MLFVYLLRYEPQSWAFKLCSYFSRAGVSASGLWRSVSSLFRLFSGSPISRGFCFHDELMICKVIAGSPSMV